MRNVLTGLIFLLCLFCLNAKPASPQTLPAMDFLLNGIRFKLEIASTPEQTRKGLMFRTELPEYTGMLFLFSREKVMSFWMKNTLIPLDIIFVNKHGKITAVHSMQPEPPRASGESLRDYEMRLPGYSSVFNALFAIELPAGTLKKHPFPAGSYLSIIPQIEIKSIIKKKGNQE